MTDFNDDWTLYHCKQSNRSIRDIVHKGLVTYMLQLDRYSFSIDCRDHMAVGTLLPTLDQDVVIDQFVVGISDEVKRAWDTVSNQYFEPASRQEDTWVGFGMVSSWTSSLERILAGCECNKKHHNRIQNILIRSRDVVETTIFRSLGRACCRGYIPHY